MTLAAAIDDLQAKALALTTVSIKVAKSPQDETPPLPACVVYLASGEAEFISTSQVRIDCVINVNFYFNRSPLATAFAFMTLVAIEYLLKLAADPKLSNSVTSVIHPTFEIIENENWNGQAVNILSIHVPVKTVEVPA